MPSTSRPRGFSGASNSSGRPGPNTPKSERQQMALLMQMTSSNQSDMNSGGHGPARSRDRNERGETALHVAAIKGDQDSVKKLLEQGMSANVTDFAGWTPLHEACNHGHYNVALTLVKAGANVNAKGLEDDTPLHDAAILGQMKLVKMLVERGADPGFKNRKGKTPCDVASSAVYNYLTSARAANRSSSAHQLKKPPDTKKTHTDDDDLMTNTGHINTTNINSNINNSNIVNNLTSMSHTNITSGPSSSNIGHTSNIMHSNIISQSTISSHALSNAVNTLTLNPHINNPSNTNPINNNPSNNNSNNNNSNNNNNNNNSNNNNNNTSNNNSNININNNNSNININVNNNSNNNLINTKEDDIYEFKTTPHDTHNKLNELKIENIHNKNLDKMHCDEKLILLDDHNQMIGGGVSGHHQFIGSHINKRQYGEMVDGSDDILNMTEDESKRKKRKDSDTIIKEMAQTKASTNIRGIQPRQDKNSKVPGPASKTLGLNAKTSTQISTLERKSPCASPKPLLSVGKTTDSDAENEDGRGCDANSERSGGPKVPPLKIVIPQQNNSGDQETGSRNGKNASTRNSALPYVVASSNNESEKEGSRCNSPVDMLKSSDEKSIKGTSEERAQQRVLRSSHRSGVGGGNGGNGGGGNGSSGQPVDRSNNSSPQLHISSSPSPAFSNSSDTGAANTQNVVGSNNPSPLNSSHNMNESDVNMSESSPMAASSTSSSSSSNSVNGTSNSQQLQQSNTVELHPRKRKIRASKEDTKTTNTNTTSIATINNENQDAVSANSEIHPHDQPITNCYQMHLNIRKQIERRQKSLFPVQPKPPQGFKDYLMNRCSYVLAGKTPSEPTVNYPSNISTIMKEIFTMQEKERHKLKMQHIVEKEKLVLAVEQEILRVHGRAARALANQSLSFSVCTILKDEEVYNMITPEQEEKDRNARSRYNGRLFLSWLQDVDDKWEKIKEEMIFRHHNEAESLHAVQKMDWEWKMKELSLCEYKAKPVIEDTHVPMVHVSDDFDLLPA